MELTFNNVDGKWVAEFTAASDFNLHIEKGEGLCFVSQSGVSGGKYDNVAGIKIQPYNRVFDADLTAAVYPKYMKIVCEVKPTMAVVTFKAE